MESIFFELLLPNTKPIPEGTIYPSPNQANFMGIFNENLSKLDTNNGETYILGDFNINLWQNGLYVFQKKTCFLSFSPEWCKKLLWFLHNNGPKAVN